MQRDSFDLKIGLQDLIHEVALWASNTPGLDRLPTIMQYLQASLRLAGEEEG